MQTTAKEPDPMPKKTPRKANPTTTSSRLKPETVDWFQRYFPSLSGGTTFTIEMLPTAYAHTMAEVRGRFSLGELSMILDVLNGHGNILCYGSSSMAGQHIELSIHDSFRLYPGVYEDKWNIPDPAGFQKRLAGLTHFQKIAIEIWAAGFWENHETAKPEDWCKPLVVTEPEPMETEIDGI
jgi:hypothetical protein